MNCFSDDEDSEGSGKADVEGSSFGCVGSVGQPGPPGVQVEHFSNAIVTTTINQ